MCNVPKLPSLSDISAKTKAIFASPLTLGSQELGVNLAGQAGLTSEAFGIPTTAELSGAEAAKEIERQQNAQIAQAERRRVQSLEEQRMARQRASERLARGGLTRAGRASTLLTGPQGLMSGGTSARRQLLPG